MMTGPWLLYGANGYTGELIARLAVARGHLPVLAGRRADAQTQVASSSKTPDDGADVDMRNTEPT